MIDLKAVAVDALYLAALINPLSKVSVLLEFAPEYRDRRFLWLTVESTAAAAGILLGVMILGDWFLRSVFRVDLHSLRIAGGTVVFWVGLNALRRGVFFEHDAHAHIQDIALVPLACPMIAGPATIAACIGLKAEHGIWPSTLAMVIALGLNHLAMMLSPSIGRSLGRLNLFGPLIRLTGLIVMTIGTQMVLDGLAVWIATHQR